MLRSSLVCLLLIAGSSQADVDDVASRPPLDFAMALVDLGVPVGVELRRGEDLPVARPDVDTNARWPPPVEMANMFNRRHREHAAQLKDGVIVIRPVERPTSTLDRAISLERRLVQGLIPAQRALFATLDPSQGTGGVMGSYIQSSAESRGDLAAVYIGGPTQTLQEFLNGMIVQVPHQGWFVVTVDGDKGSTVVEYGLIQTGGSTSRTGFYDDRH